MLRLSWFIAALIFFSFSLGFWRFGTDPIRSFAIRERFGIPEPGAGESESDKLITAFLRDFDGYLKSINERNRFRYRIAAGGFLIAALASILLALSIS
jgi:hypothetical protein